MNNTGTYYAGFFNAQSTGELEVLEKTVAENPISSIARFLLLDYYKKNNHPEYQHFSDQSILYFSNPYWIQYQLSEIPQTSEEVQEKLLHESNEEDAIEDLAAPHPETIEETGQEAAGSEALITEEEDAVQSQNIENPVFTDHDEEPDVVAETTEQVEEEREAIIESEFTSSQPIEDVAQAGEVTALENTENAEVTTEVNHEENIEKVIEEAAPETTDQNNSDTIPVAERPVTEETASVETESISEDVEKSGDAESNSSADDSEDDEEDTIEFEPLYTVDYFASQGIKIKEETLMNDKLGQQVKSFTAWLKSMKKLHPGKLPEQNEVIERIIQSSAEESNADAEVLTEAMAEVLIKQNKHEKAIEMYRKLSLLNPAKSTYFAAKIESIKTN